jgi:hypothetical protein
MRPESRDDVGEAIDPPQTGKVTISEDWFSTANDIGQVPVAVTSGNARKPGATGSPLFPLAEEDVHGWRERVPAAPPVGVE